MQGVKAVAALCLFAGFALAMSGIAGVIAFVAGACTWALARELIIKGAS